MPEQKLEILLVDDEPENIELLMDMLGDDYRLLVASNGAEALNIMHSETPPDMVILDIMMPGMDGYEVCRRLKAGPKTRDIPVIFITARTQETDEAKGFESGAVDYITKPFSLPIISARVRTHLDLKQQRANLEGRTRQLNMALQAIDIRSRFIRQTFGRYLSEDVVDTILETPEGLQLVGEKREVTILMSDLRGFTTLSDRLPAEDIVGILNIYLEEMTEVILKYKGTIDEFIGDAILAIFGAPVKHPDDASRAVACALEMQNAMTAVNTRCKAKGYPEMKQGIGINTGDVVVGNIGSKKRIKYAAVGRNVNIASRIQSYTTGGQIYISERTKECCGDHLRIDGRMEMIPKGLSQPVTIYEIGGIGGDFNIYLPKKKSLQLPELSPPIVIQCKILTENQVINKVHKGKLTRLGDMEAVIRTKRSFRKHTNLKISLLDETGKTVSGDLYARVTDGISQSPLEFLVLFTSMVPEAFEFLERHRGGDAPDR